MATSLRCDSWSISFLFCTANHCGERKNESKGRKAMHAMSKVYMAMLQKEWAITAMTQQNGEITCVARNLCCASLRFALQQCGALSQCYSRIGWRSLFLGQVGLPVFFQDVRQETKSSRKNTPLICILNLDAQIARDFKSRPLAIWHRSDSNHCGLCCVISSLFSTEFEVILVAIWLALCDFESLRLGWNRCDSDCDWASKVLKICKSMLPF